jgi:hypothetical protein
MGKIIFPDVIGLWWVSKPWDAESAVSGVTSLFCLSCRGFLDQNWYLQIFCTDLGLYIAYCALEVTCFFRNISWQAWENLVNSLAVDWRIDGIQIGWHGYASTNNKIDVVLRNTGWKEGTSVLYFIMERNHVAHSNFRQDFRRLAFKSWWIGLSFDPHRGFSPTHQHFYLSVKQLGCAEAMQWFRTKYYHHKSYWKTPIVIINRRGLMPI